MSAHQEVDLSARELLTALVNNLQARFFEAPRLDAKQLFIAIQGGREIPFMEIRLPEVDDSLDCLLALDETCYAGTLNFSRFRQALRALMARVAGAFQDPDAVPNTFVSADGQSSLFNMPGITEHDGQVNILLTGVHQRQPGQVVLRLVFIDPGVLESAG